MARTTHRFTQLTEGKERKNFLFSLRQKKEILPHGKKFSHNLTIFWWHLLPGAYYIYHYAKQYKEWQLSLVVIKKLNLKKDEFKRNGNHSYVEEYKPVNSPPEWLTEQIDKTVHPERNPNEQNAKDQNLLV